jgi:hypothetical protein
MRLTALALALGAAICLAACGDSPDKPTKSGATNEGAAKTGAALAGDGWDGGTGLDPTQKSEKVRVVAFFKPG